MKWGIRRFQNADGSLTTEGKKRYGISDKQLNDTEVAKKAVKKIVSDYDVYAVSDLKDKKRLNAAADLGLEAMNKLGWLNNDSEPGDDSSREWFLYEDQTIGLGMIADMVNRGYTPDDCDNVIDLVKDSHISYYDYDDSKELREKNVVFEIVEGEPEVLKNFARACAKVRSLNRAK